LRGSHATFIVMKNVLQELFNYKHFRTLHQVHLQSFNAKVQCTAKLMLLMIQNYISFRCGTLNWQKTLHLLMKDELYQN